MKLLSTLGCGTVSIKKSPGTRTGILGNQILETGTTQKTACVWWGENILSGMIIRAESTCTSYAKRRKSCFNFEYEPRHVISNNLAFLHVYLQRSLCSIL